MASKGVQRKIEKWVDQNSEFFDDFESFEKAFTKKFGRSASVMDFYNAIDNVSSRSRNSDQWRRDMEAVIGSGDHAWGDDFYDY